MRRLASFCSPVERSPSFVIPVFHVPDSNLACAQNLDGTGVIQQFMPIDESHFFPVPVIAPLLSKDIGDDGLIAFWLTDNCVIVGSKIEMQLKLSVIDERSLPPFIAVEAMTLVGDASRLTEASHRASAKFSGRRCQLEYLSRISRRAALLQELANPTVPASFQIVENSLNELLEKLQHNSPPKEWYAVWKLGWKKYPGDDQLFSVAKWRIDNFDLKEFSTLIVTDLIDPKYDKKRLEYAIRWLETHGPDQRDWHMVWIRLNTAQPNREELYQLGSDLLECDLKSKRAINYPWMRVWVKIWRNFAPTRAQLIKHAEKASKVIVSNGLFIEVILLNIIDDADAPWAPSYLARWLEFPRPSIAWVSSYIFYADRLRIDQRSAIAWLKKYGKGMNSWNKLWLHIKDKIEPHEAIDLAENWLLLARKDLSAWPKVFEQVFKMREHPSERLILAARKWIDEKKKITNKKQYKLIEFVARDEDDSPDGEFRFL